MEHSEKQKVNLRIKGDLRHLIYKMHALAEAYRLGLKTNKLVKHTHGHLEMEFEGDRTQLWKIVKWSKGHKFFSSVEEVMFTFTAKNTQDVQK